MQYKRLAKFLGALAAIAVLTSATLTFAQPYQPAIEKDTSVEDHEECERIMEQMHDECAEIMDEMHHEMHQTNHTKTRREDVESHESHGHHGCHW